MEKPKVTSVFDVAAQVSIDKDGRVEFSDIMELVILESKDGNFEPTLSAVVTQEDLVRLDNQQENASIN